MLYNLGLFFCNTGNIFGLQLFDVLFELTSSKILNISSNSISMYEKFI